MKPAAGAAMLAPASHGDARMAEAAETLTLWTAEQFLDWVVEQEGRYELIDGHVVQMMAGAKKRHNIVAGNVARSLAEQLADGPCIPFQSDMAVAVSSDRVRYPDVVVDCDNADEDVTRAQEPVVVVEVLSDRTRHLDMLDKLEEYHAVPSIRHILIVETRHVSVELHTREGEGWTRRRVDDPDGALDLLALGVRLALADIYRRTDARSRIVHIAPPG